MSDPGGGSWIPECRKCLQAVIVVLWKVSDPGGGSWIPECRKCLQAVIDKLQGSPCLPVDFPTFEMLWQQSDQNLFPAVLGSETHVLHGLLPPVKHTNYNLQP